MSKENTKEPIQEVAQAPIKEKKEAPKSQAIKGNPHTILLTLVGFIFILTGIGFGISFYLWKIDQMAQSRLQMINNKLALQVKQLQQDAMEDKQDKETLLSLQNKQQSLQDSVSDFKQQWAKEVHQSSYQNQDWLLLKARYYLELAEINNHWTKDYNTSIALYQETDALFKQLNESKFLQLRQALAKDIAQLKSIPTLDTAGLLSQLEAAQEMLSKIKFQPKLNTTLAENSGTQSSESNSGWRQHMKESMTYLSKLVVIHKEDEQVQPLLSPLLQRLMKEAILLNLQRAQWAILSQNGLGFKLALKQAIEQLKKAGLKDEAIREQFVKQLKTLEQTSFPEKQIIEGQALPLLNTLIKEKDHSINLVPTKRGN